MNPNSVKCYQCKRVVTPETVEVHATSGYVAIEVPGSDAQVVRPMTKGRFVGRCPYCGAQHATADAARLNKVREDNDEAMWSVTWFICGIGALIFVVVLIGSIANGSLK